MAVKEYFYKRYCRKCSAVDVWKISKEYFIFLQKSPGMKFPEDDPGVVKYDAICSDCAPAYYSDPNWQPVEHKPFKTLAPPKTFKLPKEDTICVNETIDEAPPPASSASPAPSASPSEAVSPALKTVPPRSFRVPPMASPMPPAVAPPRPTPPKPAKENIVIEQEKPVVKTPPKFNPPKK